MKTRFLLSALFAMPLFFYTPELEAQTPAIEPSGVFLYAQKDGQDLSLSIYDPAPGSETRLDGKTKPTIIFIFGGGFIEGERDHASYLPWYKRLSESGYRVVSIDYRLGLRGVTNLGLFNNRPLEHALRLSVDDLFSATAFLLANAEELGIEPDNIVVSGSSAGAMTSLQADWEICNHMPSTATPRRRCSSTARPTSSSLTSSSPSCAPTSPARTGSAAFSAGRDTITASTASRETPMKSPPR